MPVFGVASYGVAALVYGVTAMILLVSSPSGRTARLLTTATVVSAFWGGGMAFLLVDGAPPLIAVAALDSIHMFLWTACMLSWLAPPSAQRWLLVFSATAALLGTTSAWLTNGSGEVTTTVFPSLVLMALIGLLAVEQVFRNAHEDQRAGLMMLCLAVGGIFTIDLFVYSLAAVLGSFIPAFWNGRGLSNAMLLPLIVVAMKRQSAWDRKLFVSRQVVFYTASLLAVGGYLLAMGLVAYFLQMFGGEWGLLIDLTFLLAAAVVLISVLFSTSIRARFRVLLVKHFYRNKYDYREEWLRLTQSLGRGVDLRSAVANALPALARIIGSSQGGLWLSQDDRHYERVASLDHQTVATEHYTRDHPLVVFLASTGWVIDSDEYAREPDRYGTSFGHPNERLLPPGTITVPLESQGRLLGFVVLARKVELPPLNFEDHDILKTAGRQVGVLLAQAMAQEKLAETRQFEAMNKLSAFLMHDLKNVVAQQELVVANAQRFRHRPDFIEDAFVTIRSGVERMKRVLQQLAATRSESTQGRVELSKVLMEVRSHCADREPIPEVQLGDSAIWVGMDREQLVSVLTHVVRNAQDATGPEGSIRICVTKGGSDSQITIADTGCGMDADFLRNRLFRPFDSTKGTKGMGIGAYQVRHVVRLAGGDVDVVSQVGVGTTFKITLPTSA